MAAKAHRKFKAAVKGARLKATLVLDENGELTPEDPLIVVTLAIPVNGRTNPARLLQFFAGAQKQTTVDVLVESAQTEMFAE